MHQKYLPGLNTLRFFAAFFVIIGHASLSLAKLGIASGSRFAFLNKGGDSVEFFFTLSGFLITYLLINEIDKTKTVSIKAFYLRRIVRIWPLYFLIVVTGFLVLGYIFPKLYHQNYFNFPSPWAGLLFYIFFLSNYAAQNFTVGFLFPLWSIGVEEQFYLFWAPLVKLFKTNLLLIVISFASISIIVYLLIVLYIIKVPDYLYGTLKFFKIHLMAIGCLFGYLANRQYKRCNQAVVTKPAFQVVVIIVVVWHYLIGFPFSENVFFHVLLSIFYSLLIINISVVKHKLVNLEKKPFVFLGLISYGLYMYHMIVDYGLRLIYSSKWVLRVPAPMLAISYYIMLIGITIGIAALSYQYFEKYFINLKFRYANK